MPALRKLRAYFLIAIGLPLLAGCWQTDTTEADAAKKQTAPPPVPNPPAWIMQGNIYEVNVRQYTPEGTLNAFAQHLDRLKGMGVQTLWFMPLNPISKVERKGSLGSYYAVANFRAVNPEFGTMADWKRLVQAIHARGMKVIIDWVPNHTGADNPWLTAHPDFFIKDSASGKPAVAFDWADVRQLDYQNPAMADSMIAAMKYWVTASDIDGFRCDVAWNVPAAFWKKCIPQLETSKDLFMLAEGDSAYLPRSGFDAVYPWHMFHAMEKVAAGTRPPTILDSIKAESDAMYPASTIQMYFTSNHDENSWNKADYGTFPGPVHASFAVFSQTMSHSVPLIYGGQEEPVLRPLKFFDKDPIRFGKYQRAAFYQTLLKLRKENVALAADASFRKVKVGNERALYAYVREKAGHKVLVILNFSGQPQQMVLKDKSLNNTAYNVFTDKREPLSTKPRELAPWGYAVYTYGD